MSTCSRFVVACLTLLLAIHINQAQADSIPLPPTKIYGAYIWVNNVSTQVWETDINKAAAETINYYCTSPYNTTYTDCKFTGQTKEYPYTSSPGSSWSATYTDFDIATQKTFTDTLYGTYGITCPIGYKLSGYTNPSCLSRDDFAISDKNLGECIEGVPMRGDPINAASGNHYEAEDDYMGKGPYPLIFRRYYNGLAVTYEPTLGGWHHTYQRSLKLNKGIGIGNSSGVTSVYVLRHNGKTLYFSLINGLWTADSDITDTLTELTAADGNTLGWHYTLNDNTVEVYDATGKLQTLTNRAGFTQTLKYSDSTTPFEIAPAAGLLIAVTDSYGRQLKLTYDGNSHINTLTDPALNTYQYQYDAKDNLAKVIYPDQTSRSYLYNEPGYASSNYYYDYRLITGLIDENDVRYASWHYDFDGATLSSEHANGVDKTVFSYIYDDTIT